MPDSPDALAEALEKIAPKLPPEDDEVLTQAALMLRQQAATLALVRHAMRGV